MTRFAPLALLKQLYGQSRSREPRETKTPLAGGAQGVSEMYKQSLPASAGVRNGSSVAINSVLDKGSAPYTLMSMLKQSANGVVRITPTLARLLLEHTNFAGQRKIREDRIAKHLWRLHHRAWDEQKSQLVFAQTPDGLIYLIDGQHRLTATIRDEATVGTLISIRMARNMEHVRSLYASFDQRDGVRTTGETLDGANISGEMHLRRDLCRAIFDASPLLEHNLEPTRSTALGDAELFVTERRFQVIAAWRREAEQVDKYLPIAPYVVRRKLLCTGCLAVQLVTLRYQPEKALEFWHGLAANDGLRRHDPRASLLTDFLNRNNHSGSTRQIVQAPAIAWNAFYEGRQLRIIKCHDGAPIRVAGTPFTGDSK